MSIYNEFEKYLLNNDYDVDIISDSSIRGIKGQPTNGFIVHLFFDYKYNEYNLYVSENGYKLWNSVFITFENGYRLNHENDKRNFTNLQEIIELSKLHN